jgi:transcriptional regulator with XRE-family HTH domain
VAADIAAANAVIRDLYATIGQRITQARKAQGITQGDLAAAAGLTRPSITNIEAGVQRTPLHVQLAIAQALGVPFMALIGEEEMPELAPALPPVTDRLHERLRALRDELDLALDALNPRKGARS